MTAPATTPAPTAAAPVIRLRGLGRSFPGPPPVTALHPADLAVHSGEYVAITGPSGSGKSTLLHLLGLLDTPTTGSYELDGIDTARLSDRDRSTLRGRRIGFVFQSFHLLAHRTAEENVQLAQVYNRTPRTERGAAARAALAQVGLVHRTHALPSTLSGGERQRVAIARALVNRPSLLLCDEPTGNLDSANATAVLAQFDELHDQGFTLLVITHDPAVAARAQRTVRIADGRLTEPGREPAVVGPTGSGPTGRGAAVPGPSVSRPAGSREA
ncbi:ABC transporter ATP-binding protein [Kitasatospora sp. RG8]|uniref:ABC transporter ATP-binding protein n=1 Tax=Kitasatospora sp. RG8 TaxID=2820815 RepID=UPI001ADF103A|nr:ABC transporter ATP-binding protein [Kitasatospora sp. RG8]MBP0448736.1 ABC transporter ATP-binding protein [Kitasatospora sp. RG8]